MGNNESYSNLIKTEFLKKNKQNKTEFLKIGREVAKDDAVS